MTRPANENPKLKGNPFYDQLYRDIPIPLSPDACTDPYRFIPQFILDQDKGRRNQTYAYDYQPDILREHHIRYYQTITGLDHVIGELLADLKKRGRQLDHLVSSLDYTRTLLDYAGLEAPPQMTGRSLRPLVEGHETPWRDELFLESLFTMRDNPFQEGIRTQRWKYIRMYDGKMNFKEADVDFRDRAPEFEMLFDLDSDPAEHRNLVQNPQQAAILDELRKKTATQSIAINQQRETFLKANVVQPRLSQSKPEKSKK